MCFKSGFVIKTESIHCVSWMWYR